MKNFKNRQKLRRALIIFSFLLLPATFAYISCPIIIEAASKGIASGGLIVFGLIFLSSLFVGRLWCGWLCPGGGLQEIYFQINNKPFKAGRLSWLKHLLFLVIILIPLISAIDSAGGIEAIDLFYGTENGISIARADSYVIFFVQIAFFSIFALLGGKRGFCHYFCPIAAIMILGRKMRNIFAWPALHLSAETDRCTDCMICSKSCPMSLDVNNMVREEKMENSECILCGCCLDHCPEGAIRYAWFG
jgi:polyferredoxin